jgi:hypothetical protein
MSVTHPRTLKLPLSYDVGQLTASLHQLSDLKPSKQRSYISQTNHEAWGGISLHAIGGRWDDASAGGPSLAGFQETEAVQRAPYFKQVLDSLECPKQSVRISVMGPKGRIKPHVDTDIGFDRGVIRLHIPIITNPHVEFFIDNQPVSFTPGHLWFGDFRYEHHVYNGGDEARTHIVADVCINDFVLKLFPEDFIAAQPKVLKYQPPISLTPVQLERYSCAFVAAGKLEGTPLAQLLPVEWGVKGDFQGRIRLANGKLVIAIHDMDVIALEPIAEDRFRLLGGPLHVWLEFEGASQGRVSHIALVTPTERLRIPTV